MKVRWQDLRGDTRNVSYGMLSGRVDEEDCRASTAGLWDSQRSTRSHTSARKCHRLSEVLWKCKNLQTRSKSAAFSTQSHRLFTSHSRTGGKWAHGIPFLPGILSFLINECILKSWQNPLLCQFCTGLSSWGRLSLRPTLHEEHAASHLQRGRAAPLWQNSCATYKGLATALERCTDQTLRSTLSELLHHRSAH